MNEIEQIRKLKIGVLAGGWSNEREISLRSGKNVYNALKNSGCNAFLIDVDKNITEVLKKEAIELAYIALHGPFGEDGGIQALLDMLGIPHTGSSVLASALGMNKIMAKRVVMSVGVKTPPFMDITDYKNQRNSVIEEVGFPLVVKPKCEGSSIGVMIIENIEELDEIVDESILKYNGIFVEKFIKGREITIGVLSSKYEEIPLPILELKPKKQFYDFEAKYTKGMTDFILPAGFDEITTKKFQNQALLVHNTIGCKGATRTDFIVDENLNPYFLEINTSPGMTDTSDIPAEAKCMGINMEELVIKIVKSAFSK